MSTLVSTISSAVQSLVAKTGHGVESCTTMADAKPFEVTLAQRAPTKDSKDVYYGACACDAVHLEVSLRGALQPLPVHANRRLAARVGAYLTCSAAVLSARAPDSYLHFRSIAAS
jgi:hypothetical protein